MPLRPLLPTILLAFLFSIIVIVLAAARDAGTPLALAVALFAVQIIFAALRINAAAWRADAASSADVGWAWSNSVLAAIVYAWGAAAMFAVYSLSGLYWRHWWQYGAGMLLLAGATLLCARLLASDREEFNRRKSMTVLIGLTALQAVCVGGGLAYLIVSGKLSTHRQDWVANEIFAAGGVMLVLLSLASLLTHRHTIHARANRRLGV